MLMRMATVWLVAGFVLNPSSGASGQGLPVDDCRAEPGGTIRGVVVDDRTGQPVPMSNIYHFGGCRTTADRLGRFILRRVPPGEGRVEPSFPGYRSFTPVTVDVVTGETSIVERRLVPGGPLEDCRALAACAGLVDGGPGPIRNEDAAFRLVALGTAIGLAWRTVTEDGGWHACIDEPDDVRAALGERYMAVANVDECELGRSTEGHRLLHVITDSYAFQPWIEGVTIVSPRRRTVSLMYYVGPHWAAEWDCDFERTSQGWRPTLCILTSVS